MPVKLSTTVNKISLIGNSTNVSLIQDFYEYLKNTGASEKHINNNLKAIMNFANHIDCRLLSIVIDELKEALSRAKADQISTQEMQFTIPNDKYPQLKAAMDNSTNSIYVTFDKSGVLEGAEPDTVG